MVEYECPNCRGGFTTVYHDPDECPWCGQALDGSYEHEPQVKSILRAKDNGDEGRQEGVLGRLFA